MKKLWRNNGLTLILLVFFVCTLCIGQFATGMREYNSERAGRGEPELTVAAYLGSSHFLEATMENWESEFFQMFIYITLTAHMFQKGSAESHNPDDPRSDEPKLTRRSPWAARRGGWVRAVYGHSLSLAFFALFMGSFFLHAKGGARLFSEERVAHGESAIGTLHYMGTSRFWFESFQNWQSEFLAIAAMVVLSIYLREKGSPESKSVNTPHSENEP